LSSLPFSSLELTDILDQFDQVPIGIAKISGALAPGTIQRTHLRDSPSLYQFLVSCIHIGDLESDLEAGASGAGAAKGVFRVFAIASRV
jgi:hypothetical protein